MTRNWLLGASSMAALLAAPNCATTDSRNDETHFVCSRQSDCDERAPGTVCTAGYCRHPGDASGGQGNADASAGGSPSGGGGAGGVGGAACDDGTQPFCASGMGGGAGAPHYFTCLEWESAGLRDAQCPGDAGASQAALVSWCEHFMEQITPSTHMWASLTTCVGQMLEDISVNEPVLDLDKVCDPTLPEKLRTCSDAMTPCERPPLCVSGGTFTCADIRAACPAVTAEQCRSGFDTAQHSGRLAIHQCLTAAPEAEDCVDAFYRCVWGLDSP